jgi:hypothetical protein
MQPSIQEITSFYPNKLLASCFSNKIPSKLKNSFIKNLLPLEDNRNDVRDYRLASVMGRGTGKIHDIVDPNMNCLENSWIATEFELKNQRFQINDEINNINRKTYPNLYQDIEGIFNEMVPYMTNVRDLGSYLKNYNKLNVIVKIQSYQMKAGETYWGQFHQEGFKREGIFMIGIYYFHISPRLKGGNLELKFVKEKNFDPEHGCLNYLMEKSSFQIQEDDIAIFLNRRCEHRLGKLEVQDGKPGETYERKILVFFIADPLKSCIQTSKNLTLNKEVVQSEKDIIYAKRDDFKKNRFVTNSKEVDYSETEGDNKAIKEVFKEGKKEAAKSISDSQKFQLFVKRLEGTMFEIECSSNLLVEEVKEIIYIKDKTPVDEQRLIYAGKQLSDGMTLEQYNIGPESIIYLVKRLRGD